MTNWHQAIAEMKRQQEALVAAGQWLTGPIDFLSCNRQGTRRN